MTCIFGGRRPVGEPKRRWIYAVEEESKKILSLRKWKRETVPKQEQRGSIQEAKALNTAVAQ